jgi:hypothetical protein
LARSLRSMRRSCSALRLRFQALQALCRWVFPMVVFLCGLIGCVEVIFVRTKYKRFEDFVMTKRGKVKRGPGRPTKEDAIRRENTVSAALTDEDDERLAMLISLIEGFANRTGPSDKRPVRVREGEVVRAMIGTMLDEFTNPAKAVPWMVERGWLTAAEGREALAGIKAKKDKK